ncbi:MAG: hypothetical protein MJ241_06060 [Bacilli bacterium]|nr:hypothetical protein [Bacilli bacterium]
MKLLNKILAICSAALLVACSGGFVEQVSGSEPFVSNNDSSLSEAASATSSESWLTSEIQSTTEVPESSDPRVDINFDEPRSLGELIYDRLKDVDAIYGDLVIRELPDFYLYIGVDGQAYEHKGDAKPVATYFSLYLSDVNKDGYRDLCYVKQTKGSSPNYYVEIFDVKNDQVIFDIKPESLNNYFLELREGFIYVLQAKPSTNPKEDSISSGFIRYSKEKGIYINWIVPEVITKINVSMFQEGETTKQLDITDTVVVSTYFTYVFSVTIESNGEITYPEISSSLLQPIKVYRFESGMMFRVCFKNADYSSTTFRYQNATETIKIVVDDTKFVGTTVRDLYPELRNVTPDDIEYCENIRPSGCTNIYGVDHYERFEGLESKIKAVNKCLDSYVCLIDEDLMPDWIVNESDPMLRFKLKNGEVCDVVAPSSYQVRDSKGRVYYHFSYGTLVEGGDTRTSYYRISKIMGENLFAQSANNPEETKSINIDDLYKIECSSLKTVNYSGDVNDYEYVIKGYQDIYVFDKKTFGILFTPSNPNLVGLYVRMFTIDNEYTFDYLFDN